MTTLLLSHRARQRHRRLSPIAAAAACSLFAFAVPAQAFTVDTGIEGLKLTWDNTVKYSTAFRLKSQDAALVGSANANWDDGDRNFDRGLISNLLDLLSELDLQYRDVGLRVSGAAWYDDVYNRHNDNPGLGGDAYPNQTSTAYNEFTRATRNLHGRKAEVLDAFAFARFDLGGMRATVRAGRHALTWGESLFFGGNAIAGGMAPVDVIKLASVPGTQFKEAIRPVPQLSGQLQLTPALTLGAYYQVRWEANRLPAVGSYFSQLDVNPDGAERLMYPFAPYTGSRSGDEKPRNSGQGGVQLRFNHAGTDYGLYAIRFHSKSFQQVSTDFSATPIPGVFVPGRYYLTYHEGVRAYGASASHTFGPANVAAEVSIRTNQDLASSQASTFVPGFYAVGRTAHANVSTLWSLDPTPLFNEAMLAAEIAWNRVLTCQSGCTALDPNTTRDATGLRLQFEPTYRQVLDGLDLGVPIGLGYAPRGSRSRALGPGNFPAENGGDLTIGLNGTYLDAWRFTLAYTHYYGAAKPFLDANSTFTYGQSLKDRDFIAFSLRRTF